MTQSLEPETLGKLLGMVAHDLRNPLAAIHSNLGFLGTLDCLDDDSVEAVSDGLVSCDSLGHIIDNLDLLGQALRRELGEARQRFSLAVLVREVLGRAEDAARSHAVGLVFDPASAEAAVEAFAVRDSCRRALDNLIRNAIQLAPARSTVTVSIHADDRAARVIVEDAGVRPKAALRGEIFTPEGQVAAKAAPTGRYSRGLGLLGARIAADRAGASVRVVDPPSGDGNAFELSVPRE